MKSKINKKKKKLWSTTVKLEKADERAVAAEKKAKSATKEAIDNYEKSSTFQDKLHEARVESYDISYGDCLDKVKICYPDLDISKIMEDSDEED